MKRTLSYPRYLVHRLFVGSAIVVGMTLLSIIVTVLINHSQDQPSGTADEITSHSSVSFLRLLAYLPVVIGIGIFVYFVLSSRSHYKKVTHTV